MPRHSSPKIYKIVLYGVVIYLNEDGNRTDENRPSKKDPRKRRNKNNSQFHKPFIKKKKKLSETFPISNKLEKTLDDFNTSILSNDDNILKIDENKNDEFFKNYANFDYDSEINDDYYCDFLSDFSDKGEFN